MGTEVGDFPFPVLWKNQLTVFGNKLFKISLTVKGILHQMTWTDEDVVMDIGCGNGFKTVYVVIPIIKKYKTFLAIDEEKTLVEYAKSSCIAKNLEYHEADIEDITSFPKEILGTVTKIVSFDCFYGLKNDVVEALRNVFTLLAPEGEALIHFPISSPLRYICEDMANSLKWKQYVEGSNIHKFYTRDFYKLKPHDFSRILSEIGFEILYCYSDVEVEVSESDEDYKDIWKTTLDFISIPEDRKIEFLEYASRIALNLYGRTLDEKPATAFTKMTIHARKPNI